MVSRLEEGRAGLDPGALAAMDKSPRGKTGCVLLLVAKDWGLIPKGALEGGQSNRGGGEGFMNIFQRICSDQDAGLLAFKL